MSKYGFDYYIQRAKVLSEGGGRPSKLLTGDWGAKLSEYIKKISPIMKAGGEIDYTDVKTGEPIKIHVPGYVGNVQNRVYRYIVQTIADFEGLDAKDTEERYTAAGYKKNKINAKTATDTSELQNVTDATPLFALKILGITDKTASATGLKVNDLLSKAFAKWASENPEKLTSPEFANKLLSPQNILWYLKDNRLPKTGAAKIKEQEVEKTYHGLSVEDVHAITSKAAPLLAKINKAHGHKYGRKTKAFTREKLPDLYSQKKSEKETPKDKFELDLENNNTDNAHVISGVLKVLNRTISYFKNKYNELENVAIFARLRDPDEKRDAIIETLQDQYEGGVGEKRYDKEHINMMLNANQPTIEAIINMVVGLHDVGISFGSLFKKLVAIKEKFSTNKKVVDTIDLIEWNLYFSGVIAQFMGKARKEGEYRGFDPEILKTYLVNPEDKQIFDLWYDKIYIPEEENRARMELELAIGEISGNLTDEKRKFDAFENQKYNAKGNPVNRTGVFANRDEERKIELEQKPKSEWSKLDYMDAARLGLLDKDNDMDENKALEVLRAHTREKLGQSIKSESYVMNYMTEQVKKDRFKPRGEFRDRGFRKMNYLEWLEKNQ